MNTEFIVLFLYVGTFTAMELWLHGEAALQLFEVIKEVQMCMWKNVAITLTNYN